MMAKAGWGALLLVFTVNALPQKRIAVLWNSGKPEGRVQATDGKIIELLLSQGKLDGEAFSAQAPARLEILAEESAVVSVATRENPFTFFVRDVDSRYPMYIPAYGVAVTEAEDARTYRQLEQDVRSRGGQTQIRKIESEPEESYDSAAKECKSMKCQTWLGLSRDMRIFSVSDKLDSIQPKFHASDVSVPDVKQVIHYDFQMGRGWGCVDKVARRLEDGCLPILRGTVEDEEIRYEFVSFVTLEASPIEKLRGTHFLVADQHSACNVLTAEQRKRLEEVRQAEMNPEEETVLWARVTAVNTGRVPRYAFFRNVVPEPPGISQPYSGTVNVFKTSFKFAYQNGFPVYAKTGRVFCVPKLNGKPFDREDASVLVKPGESAVFEFALPHRPIDADRAKKLAEQEFDRRYEECRAFWRKKLDRAARIRLPEPKLTEILQAGLLHLDINCYGKEPDGAVEPAIGVYAPIGSQSDPMIFYFDSMGQHDLARRCLNYFLEKQHENGFMQNFTGYMLETGAILYTLGEHYRYTRDEAWVQQIKPKVLKACEFIRQWRERNRREELRGKGYGMIEGKCADPEDPFHSFMLNGYAYLGFARVAEMLAKTDPAESEKWRKEAEGLRADIRENVSAAMARSPVMPLGDGTWCPTCPPWAEGRGALMQFADAGPIWSHGSFTTRDSLLGPLYLIYQQVIEPNELTADFLVHQHAELMTRRNVALSEPSLVRNPIAHLLRNEPRAFLKTYYNTLASLQDRETYTFWEHYFGVSPHAGHSEDWHMMEARWMLWLERGETLQVFAGIPRAYLEPGKRIDLERVVSYFGPFDVHAVSKLDQGRIEATIEFAADRRPGAVEIRLPHPSGQKAQWVKGGKYIPERETVRIESFSGRAQVVVGFTPAPSSDY